MYPHMPTYVRYMFLQLQTHRHKQSFMVHGLRTGETSVQSHSLRPATQWDSTQMHRKSAITSISIMLLPLQYLSTSNLLEHMGETQTCMLTLPIPLLLHHHTNNVTAISILTLNPLLGFSSLLEKKTSVKLLSFLSLYIYYI